MDFSNNIFSGAIPYLHILKNITHLDLSNNLLTGVISSTAWEQLLNLVFVDLGNNSLNGNISLFLFELSILPRLQLADNQFDVQIPKFSNASSSAIDTLNLIGNKLYRPFPIWVFELKNLIPTIFLLTVSMEQCSQTRFSILSTLKSLPFHTIA